MWSPGLNANGGYHCTAIAAAVVPYGIKVDYDVWKPFGNNIMNSYRPYGRTRGLIGATREY